MNNEFVDELIAIGLEIGPKFTALCPKLEFPTDPGAFRANLQDFPDEKRLTFRNFLRNGLWTGVSIGFYWDTGWESPPSFLVKIEREKKGSRPLITQLAERANILEHWQLVSESESEWTILAAKTAVAERSNNQIAEWCMERIRELDEAKILDWISRSSYRRYPPQIKEK